jgi:tetratricopeptide (TPR) repeat protein
MRYVLLLAAGISLFACNAPTSSSSKKDSRHPEQGQSTAIGEDQILDKNFILNAAAINQGKNKTSDRYFLTGVDAYRNKKNPEEGAKLFKQSIMEQPQARAYFELGNALADLNNLKDAASAYEIAEALDYKPTSKVLYNLACVYSRAEDRKTGLYYLVSAIEFGYSNMKNIYEDKDLAYLREYESEFKSSVTAALSGATDPDKLQWNLFWHEFKPIVYPLTLDEKYGEKLGEDYISYEYERFVAEMSNNAKFSREVGFEFYHVGLARSGDSVKTLIYAVRNVIMDGDAPPEYYIASFDHYGKLIDKLQIGGQKKLADPFRVATLSENGNIEIGLFKKVYEKDPEENGYADNKVVENKFLEKEFYSITEDGHFQKRDELLGMNL